MNRHERDAFSGAHIGEPIPGEHALGRHDEVVSRYGATVYEQGLRCRWHSAMHEHLAGGVEHAHIHRLHVQIDPAIVLVLVVVESHLSFSSCADARIPCAEPTDNEQVRRGRAE